LLIESQRQISSMILTYRYRLLPTRQQHRVLETILESQRQLYNAALEERIDAYRKANVTRTYFDQTKALTEWRQDDPEASALAVALQRATLKRLDEAYKALFRRVKSGGKPGFPMSAMRAVDRPGPECRTEHPASGRSGPRPA
jgi:putative transposase